MHLKEIDSHGKIFKDHSIFDSQKLHFLITTEYSQDSLDLVSLVSPIHKCEAVLTDLWYLTMGQYLSLQLIKIY